jgi:hypothetical protein
MTSASQQHSIGVGGSTPPSVSTRRESWPHVGTHLDRILIRPYNYKFLSVYFQPCCPRCHRTKHPNVTRSAGWPPSKRHCNHCGIRWTHDGPAPFCSSHGQPESVLEMLFYGRLGREYGHDGLLNGT